MKGHSLENSTVSTQIEDSGAEEYKLSKEAEEEREEEKEEEEEEGHRESHQ